METPGRIAELERKFADNPRRYFAALANEYRKGGELERSIELCQRHLAEQRNHLSGHVVLAQALVDAGREQEAWDSLHTALDLDPENVIALRLIGDLCARSGEPEQAREYYFRALDIEPRNEQLLAALKGLGQRRAEEPVAAQPDAVVAPGDEVPETEGAGAAASGRIAAEPSWRDWELPTWISPEAETAAATPDTPAPVTREDTTPAAAAPDEASGEPSADIWDFPQDEGVDRRDEDADRVESVRAAETGEHVEIAEDQPAAEQPAIAGWIGPATEAEDFERVEGAQPPDIVTEEVDAVSRMEAVREEDAGELPETSAEPAVEVETTQTAAAESRPTLVSETMADLYLQQGHAELALATLRELAEARPGDDRLKARLEELERVALPPRRETVRDLFARLGRKRAGDSEAASALAEAFASGERRGPVADFFGGVAPDAHVPADAALAAVLAEKRQPESGPLAFDEWLQSQRTP